MTLSGNFTGQQAPCGKIVRHDGKVLVDEMLSAE